MQNRYVGDIGDFGKYGLLRGLCGFPEAPVSKRRLKLGVVWYLNPSRPDDSNPSDVCSKPTYRYLKDTANNLKKFQECDPNLYDVLKQLVDTGNRKVSSVCESNILPIGKRYHEKLIFGGPRGAWFESALQATNDAEVVFVDPDNGIDLKADTTSSPNHVSIGELRRLFQSVAFSNKIRALSFTTMKVAVSL